jgi:hypothetical protein
LVFAERNRLLSIIKGSKAILLFFGRCVFLKFANSEKYRITDPLMGFFRIIAYGEADSS